MADENEPRGWIFDEEPQNESQDNSADSQTPTQPPAQPPAQPPQPTVQPPQPPQPPREEQQPPKYVQSSGVDQPSQAQEVHSIFDVAGEMSPSEKKEPEVDPEIEAQLKRERREQQIKVAIKGIIGFAGILALIYAAMFVYRMVTTVTPGSSSPQAVIESTFSALENKDLIGVLRQLDPEETEPLFTNRDLFTSFFQQNEEIASSNQPLTGFNISVEGLETETTPIMEDLARVELIKGKISADIDETQLPRNASLDGDELRDVDIEELNTEWAKGNFNKLTGAEFNADSLESKHIFYMAIKRDGRWYFSSLYTAAEYLRITANANGWDIGQPTYDSSVFVARGGATPEDAVRNFVNSILDLDSQPAIDMFSRNLFPPVFEYRDVIQAAEDFNEENLYFRAVRQGVELNNLSMAVRDLHEEDPENPYRFVAITSLILNVNYDLEVTTSDIEKFGFVPYAARLLVNWDGRCLSNEGAYALLEGTEVTNETPAFPIIDADDVEFTAQELNRDPDLSAQIVFPVIDSNNNVFEDVESFNGGSSTKYEQVTKEISERNCYRQNPSDFPEVGVMTVQEGSNYFISPIDTFWYFASWIVTGNYTFDS